MSAKPDVDADHVTVIESEDGVEGETKVKEDNVQTVNENKETVTVDDDEKDAEKDEFDSDGEGGKDDKMSSTVSEKDIMEVISLGDLPVGEKDKINPKRFKCRLCGHLFTRAYDVKIHRKKFCIKREDHKCSMCSQVFPSKTTLTKHIKKIMVLFCLVSAVKVLSMQKLSTTTLPFVKII